MPNFSPLLAILTITRIISILSYGAEDIEGKQEIVVIDGRGWCLYQG